MFGKSVSSDLQNQIKDIMGITKIGGLGKYLGLPETVDRNKCSTFGYLAQRVQQKLDNWYSNLLSPAGKEVLIKSVATALPTYAMSCFMLPKRLTTQITRHIRAFWWSTSKEKQKIPWTAWTTMTQLKQYGGMGFKDLQHFNVAFLAKQSWRMLKDPNSLLHKVLQAKYFSKTSLLDSTLGHRPSHAWRSILQGLQLLKQGLKWRVGDGKTIRVGQDLWLDNPPRPASTLSDHQSSQLMVSDLIMPHSSCWDEGKMGNLLVLHDVQLIKRIHLRHIRTPDMPTWIFTKDGQYTVKSGYHQLIKQNLANVSHQNHAHGLWQQIWKINAPPKIKHFWWKILHNALPVADNIARRKIRIQRECSFCGEEVETVTHLLFQCRVAREVWEMAPLRFHPRQFHHHQSIFSIVQELLSSQNSPGSNAQLFPFIAWRIRKARNDLFFNNKRWAIPDMINQAVMDCSLWQKAFALNESQKPKNGVVSHTPNEISAPNTKFYCYVDASWVDANSKAGIGWILLDNQGRSLLKGSSSIEPINSVLEAEAEALTTAVLQLKRLNYRYVIFCGDSSTIYRYLERVDKQNPSLPSNIEIQGYMADILSLAPQGSSFKYVRRDMNHVANVLAKEARTKESPYIISWNS